MKLNKLDPRTSIKGLDGISIVNFWSWAYSDILSNRNRSIFAEFIVASALGVIENPRIEWDAVDVEYNGIKIEVKSAAYIQSWEQKVNSIISFDIAKKRAWHADTNTYEKEAVRSADCYVFSLFNEKDRVKANVLDINSWEFYVVPTRMINEKFKD